MDIIDTRPELFFKPATSIWTDPYIQQNLLKAHLDVGSDAASRNTDSIKKTVDFIDEQLKAPSKVLDLGCGPGFYAKLLSQKQHTVVGVDFNKAAIEYAKQYSPDSQFICADYIKDFPAGVFDAMMMIYCDMGTHSDAQRDVLLKNCYQALNVGGKLIFDVFDENLAVGREEVKTWGYTPQAGFWSDTTSLLLKQTFHYPEHRVFADQYNLIVEGSTQYFLIWERYYLEEEIVALLKTIGFREVQVKRNLLTTNNFTSSHEMFIVAQK